jgi:FkbM family methyltransferase
MRILCATHGITQKIIRFCASRPALDSLALFLTHYAIAIYRRVCTEQSIVTSYDRDLQIAVRLTSLLEANLYFLGIDGKDRGEFLLFKRMIKPDFVVLDVGGNIGQTALIAAKRATHGSVYVFEPSSNNYERLISNINLNQFKNVNTIHAAVSNQIEPLKIYKPRTYNSGAISAYPDVDWEADVEIVPCVRLDDYKFSRVDVIKLDVEGAELDVLEGAKTLIHQLRPHVLMEVTVSILNRAQRSVDEIFQFWKEMGYCIFLIDKYGNTRAIATPNELGLDQNLLCSPCERLLEV